MKLKIQFIFLLLIANCTYLAAQLPTLEWVNTWPHSDYFRASAYALALDDSGNAYVTGHIERDNPVMRGYCTIKYSASGTFQWTANYYGNNTGGRFAFAIALDKYSNVYVTGYSLETGNYFDYCTIKYNSSGVQQWVRTYNGPVNGEDEATKIAVDNAGNIYVSGYSEISGGGFVYTTIKYSPGGEQLWFRSHSFASGNTHVTGMVIDDSCNIYITGDCVSAAVTVKYDSSGNEIWSNVYFGNGPLTGAGAITKDHQNNIIITGFTKGIPPRNRDFFTIKYTMSGLQLWERIFFYSNFANAYNFAKSIVTDISNSIYVSGITGSIQGGQYRICTIKYSDSGNLLWVQKDTSELGGDIHPFIGIDNDKNIYLTGQTSEPFSTSITIFKYSEFGEIIWKQKYYPGGNSEPYDLKVDNNYNFYITGYTGIKMLTLKYSQPMGIKQISSNVPEKYTLYQNYPNPFNHSTNLRFEIMEMRFVKLVIYDMLGREVSTPVNEELKPGTYEIDWSSSDCTSGVYFYKLNTVNYSQTRKMIILK